MTLKSEVQTHAVIENLKFYKEHLATMIKLDVKLEADLLLLVPSDGQEEPPLMKLISYWLSPNIFQ